MSTRHKPSSVDGRLHQVFGTPVNELYETVAHPDASAALARALELRSFLALAEEQVTRVRDRVHEAMAPDRNMAELSVDALRMDARWLEAALDACNGYRTAIDELLRTMPSPLQKPRPVRTTQAKLTTTVLPAAVPPPQGVGAARHRRS